MTSRACTNGFSLQLNGWSAAEFQCGWQQYIVFVDDQGVVRSLTDNWYAGLVRRQLADNREP